MRFLTDAVARIGEETTADVAAALARGKGRPLVAAGAGMTVAAEYLAVCRSSLGLGDTMVEAPQRIVSHPETIEGAELWIFGSRFEDAGAAAILRAARRTRCGAVTWVTADPCGRVAIEARTCPPHQLPSLPAAAANAGEGEACEVMAMILALLMASDAHTERPRHLELIETFLARSLAAIRSGRDALGGLSRGMAISLRCDPRLAPVGTLLERVLPAIGHPVSWWSSPLRGTDAVATKALPEAFSMGIMTGEDVRWPSPASRPDVDGRGAEIILGYGGRLDNAVGLAMGLGWFTRSANADGTVGLPVCTNPPPDPGQRAAGNVGARWPGSRGGTAAVRHKAAARARHDPPGEAEPSLADAWGAWLHALVDARFAAIVLDYDGTLVANHPEDARFVPPSRIVTQELVRLIDGGIRIGVATGRGGSAGDMLRAALPSRLHARILVGYFNGAHVRTLDVDVRRDRPARDDRIAAIAFWIRGADICDGAAMLASEVQITIVPERPNGHARIMTALASCPQIACGNARVLRSDHSIDIVPAGASKLIVADRLARAGDPASVLRIGDSASPSGNDHELLSAAHGISVGSVCGSGAGTWSLFGTASSGPDALLRILRAARIDPPGFHLDLATLGLEAHGR